MTWTTLRHADQFNEFAGQIDVWSANRSNERMRPFHRRLASAFERAMRSRATGKHNLRVMVQEIARSALLLGAERPAIRQAVLSFLDQQPSRHQLDRVSMVSGERTSERLLTQVAEWIEEV